MKGVWSSVMFVRSTSEEGITWGSIWCCSRRGFFSTVMFVGMVQTVLFVLLFIYYIC